MVETSKMQISAGVQSIVGKDIQNILRKYTEELGKRKNLIMDSIQRFQLMSIQLEDNYMQQIIHTQVKQPYYKTHILYAANPLDETILVLNYGKDSLKMVLEKEIEKL